MDRRLEKYLLDKKSAQADYDSQLDSSNTGNLFSNLGDVIAGNKVGSNNSYFQGLNKSAKENTVDRVENEKRSGYEMDEAQAKADKRDPTNQRNVAWRGSVAANAPDLVKMMAPADFEKLTMEDSDAIMNPYKWKQEAESRKEAAKALAGQRADSADERKFQRDMKVEEKMQGLNTPFGFANNSDDAKQLKEGHEAKKNFDSKLQEMISLRTKHGGGAVLNREDVSRGKQLSKDLLLEYKNMAKLGVLSQADEKIINAIIPADPLEYNSPLAAIQGQDPILKNMEKFKGDSDRDFLTRVQTRTRDGLAGKVPSLPESEDNEAMKWAIANPTDPRSSKILEHNGSKRGGR